MSWPKITFYGDSQTRRSMDPNNGCWISHIANKVAHYFQVDVRGFDGYNSKWCLQLMPKLFPKTYLDQVEMFVIFLGHNDAWNSLFEPIHVPLDQFRDNMRAIVRYLEENGLDRSKVILITPSWYDRETHTRLSDAKLPKLFKEYESQLEYSNVLKELAGELGLDLLDFMAITTDCGENMPELFNDGLHFSPKGSELLFNSLIPLIETKIKRKFNKPIEELWHVVPVREHPEVVPILEAHAKLNNIPKVVIDTSK